MSAPLVLVSHALCPYVQRAAIVLAEKGAADEATLAARPSVAHAVRADYPDLLRRFLRARGTAVSALMQPSPLPASA